MCVGALGKDSNPLYWPGHDGFRSNGPDAGVSFWRLMTGMAGYRCDSVLGLGLGESTREETADLVVADHRQRGSVVLSCLAWTARAAQQVGSGGADQVRVGQTRICRDFAEGREPGREAVHEIDGHSPVHADDSMYPSSCRNRKVPPANSFGPTRCLRVRGGDTCLRQIGSGSVGGRVQAGHLALLGQAIAIARPMILGSLGAR